MSAMRETMWRQPDDLRRVLGDPAPAERAAERIAGRRVLLAGTGTSWHAANHGAALLRLAGVEAWAVQADESVLHSRAAHHFSDFRSDIDQLLLFVCLQSQCF